MSRIDALVGRTNESCFEQDQPSINQPSCEQDRGGKKSAQPGCEEPASSRKTKSAGSS